MSPPSKRADGQRPVRKSEMRKLPAARPKAPAPRLPGAVTARAASGRPALDVPAAEHIPITRIRADGGTQMRAGLNPETVAEYADVILSQGRILAWPFPPLVVFYDGEKYWLADGFHRLAAFRQALRLDKPSDISNPDIAHTLPAIVHAGDRRAAILHAAGANAAHGLRRTNLDKRRAVETLLRDEEWRQWSDSEIGRQCNVDHKTVASLRQAILGNSQDTSTTPRKVTRKGTTYTVDTTNIGKRADPKPSKVDIINRDLEAYEGIARREEAEAVAEVAAEREEEEAARLVLGDRSRHDLTFAEWWAMMPKEQMGLAQWLTIFETAKAGVGYVPSLRPRLKISAPGVVLTLSKFILLVEDELKHDR